MNIDDFVAGEFLTAAIVKHHPQITFYIIPLYYSDSPNQLLITMWMFVLVMMVLTRTRSEDDSRVLTTQSTAEGSASTRISRSNRRRKLNSTNTTTEQPADTEQQSVDPPKRHGPNLNLSVNRPLKDLPEGSKIPLRMDEHTISFVGTSATDFATECGIIMRNFCPMNYHTWESVPEDAKTLMYEKLEVMKIRVIANKYHFYGVCECSTTCLIQEWNHLCDYWELEKTKINPET
uniref:Uncharacterized protein n=1 Tax=Helianthus annuus TaxID=4232 RepID=A0A251UR05_HELAN